ncbi:MAG: DUF177 domain-containing protein [Gammaproteobacteria bacterium]|nr:DUF177 domain-containing protein [Gammaproteobacteria bacterium]
MRGEIAAVCQRCLKPMIQEVCAPFGMLILNEIPRGTEAATEEEYLVAEQDSLDLMRLLEDELLLALPMVPRHADGTCQTAAPEESASTRANPFQALAALKERRKGSGKAS